MVVRLWELEADYRVCDCDSLNSMQIMKESSIFLDRTPTTFKLQWRFNFQLLSRAGPSSWHFFFRAKRILENVEVQALCVQLSLKCWVGGELRAPWRCRRTIRLSSSQLDAFQLIYWESERARERGRARERERGAEEERPVCIVSTEGGAATGSK